MMIADIGVMTAEETSDFCIFSIGLNVLYPNRNERFFKILKKTI